VVNLWSVRLQADQKSINSQLMKLTCSERSPALYGAGRSESIKQMFKADYLNYAFISLIHLISCEEYSERREFKMFRKILLSSLFILIFLIPLKQGINAKTWPPGSKIPADSIAIALIRGEDVNIDSCFIYESLIMGGTIEKMATIKGEVNIKNSIFLQGVLIVWSHFLKQVRLVDNSFKGAFLCNGNMFNDWVIIAGDSFSDRTSISQDTFNNIASFEESVFDSLVLFAFNRFQKVWNLRETKFNEKVDFTFSEFETITITWGQLDGHLIFYPPLLFKLIECFEQQRQLDDADKTYLFLKDQERMEKPKLKRYLEYWFIQQTCGYGVDPLRPMATSLIIIGLFFVAYCMIDIREKDLSPRILGLNGVFWNLLNGLYYSINTFIAGAPVHWYPKDESKARFYLFRILTTIERTLGWVLLVLFVVTLTRKFIR
jgi:hypothetical protein